MGGHHILPYSIMCVVGKVKSLYIDSGTSTLYCVLSSISIKCPAYVHGSDRHELSGHTDNALLIAKQLSSTHDILFALSLPKHTMSHILSKQSMSLTLK